MKKKLVSCILTVCMLLTMLPTMAWAEETGNEPNPLAATPTDLDISEASIVIDEEGDYVITQTDEEATANTITVNADATITLSGVTMSGSASMINVNADATILLKEGTTNKVTTSGGSLPAICIAVNKTLTIEGSGDLSAVANTAKSAGIGGNGNLVINGGNISAVGNGGGAAIGGCYNKSYNKFGSITITGGNVTVTSDYAGICPVTNATGGGDIVIEGGKVNVTLTNGSGYAAIGGGYKTNVFEGDVKIFGGEISVSVTGHNSAYAIHTGGNFEMTGGTLVKMQKTAASTNPYITANTVSITGGNVKEYYADDITGRKLTKLYIVDANGTPVTSEVTIKEGSHVWSAVPDENGVITTYLAEGTDSLMFNGNPYPVTPGKDSTIGVSCTCATTGGSSIAWTGVPAEITLYSGDASKTVAVSAEFVKASDCLAPVHPVDVVLSLTGEANGCTLTDGNLTINRSTGNYELTLSAVAGTLATDTKAIKINCVTDKGLDIANGYVEVVAGTEAGKVTYKQNGTEKYVNVPASEPVTITGTYTFEEGNAIKITNCSPTIVLKDLTITGVYNNTAESNILIDGTPNNHVKFILSGTNTLVRGFGESENLHLNSCGIEIREAELTIDCSCEGESCADKSCADKLIVDVQGYNRGAAIGSRNEFFIPNVEDGKQPDGYTLNIEGGQIQANSNHFGAAIGTCRVSKNVLTNKVAINISDGYVKAIANDDGVAIGAGRSDNPPNEGIVSVNISGGIVEAISKSLGNVTNATSDAILASEVTASNGAEVTVSGNLKAKKSVEVKGTGTTLELKQKENLPEEYSKNPGGNICNGAEWDVKDKDGNVIETVVRPGNVQVKVSDGAALTTEGGINGSLTTSGNATANINGVAPRSGKASTDQNVGGVSGTVTVGAGSKVTVTEEIKGAVTVEGGATINGTDLPEDVAIPAGKLGEVKVDETKGTITLPAGATVNGNKLPENMDSVTLPADKLDEVKTNSNGSISLPAGTTVTVGDKETTLTNGGTVSADGTVKKNYVGGGWFGTTTPTVTPSVDNSSLNNAAQAVGNAIADGSAELEPATGYTKEEIAKLQKEGKLNLAIEKKSGYASVADKNLIDAAIKKAGGAVSGTVVMYFDITPVLKTDDGKVVANVTDTEKPIAITIDLSADLQKAAKDGKHIAVVRCHDGKTTFLDAKLNAAKTQVTFSSADFSTYAVVAMEKQTSAQTFDAGIMVYGAMAVLAATGSAVVIGKKRK